MDIKNENLDTLIEVMILIMEKSISPGTLLKALPSIALRLAPLFNCPTHVVNGIFSLVVGDYS